MHVRGSLAVPQNPDFNVLFYMGQSPQYNSFEIPMVPGNPYLNRRSRRGCFPRLGCLITLAILIVLAIGSYTTFARSWPIFGPTTITVRTHPTLIINSERYEKIDLPTIRIHAGTDANKIVLRVMSPGNIDLPWNFGINDFQQNSDSSVIVLGGEPVWGRTLDVTVPADTDLKIYTNSANINVTDLTGQMTLTSNDGSITLTHCHIQGTSLLQNNTGAVTVTQSVLDGQTSLSNNGGPITFNSAIGVTGTYVFENNEGSIDVTLPQSDSFHVNAKTDSGSISTNYAGVQVQNNEVHANVGNDPQGVLSLNTNSGTITLHKGA
jgi:Putative adhesin